MAIKHTAKAGRGWKVTGGDSGSFHEDAQETSVASLSHAGPAQCGGYFASESQPQLDVLKPSAGENKRSGRE